MAKYFRRKPEISSGAPDVTRLAEDEEIVRKGFWKKVGGRAGGLGVVNEAASGYYAMVDPKTPVRSKAILAAALAYFVLPVDAVPDFIVGLGFSDDIAALTLALNAVRMSITPAHRAKAAARLSGQPVAEVD